MATALNEILGTRHYPTSYLERVSIAADEAPFIGAGELRVQDLSDLRDLPNDAPIHENAVFTRHPGEVIVGDACQFPDLIQSVTEQTGITVAPLRLRKIIKHERQHRWAAQRLGAQVSVFGLLMVRRASTDSPSGDLCIESFFHAAVDFRTTKLGKALVSLHPDCDLEGDLVTALELGYSGVEEIGNLSLAHNRGLPRGTPWWPIPLSHPYWREHSGRSYYPSGLVTPYIS